MVKTLKELSLNKAFVVLALGFVSMVTPIAFLQPAQSQPSTESQIRPAITSNGDQILVYSLIKSSLLSLNQANQTGNYSVLRALGSPGFQANNTDDSLVKIFQGIKDTNLDFAAITEFQPVFVNKPTLDDQNTLRAKGYFPTTPQIEFDLAYKLVNGRFVVDVLTVGIMPTSKP